MGSRRFQPLRDRNLCTDGDRVPNLAIIVNVKPVSCIVERHCDDQTWNISSWPSADERPSGAELLAAHIDEAEHVDAIATSLEGLPGNSVATGWKFVTSHLCICCFETQISVIAYSHDLQIRPSAIHNREVRSPERLSSVLLRGLEDHPATTVAVLPVT